jgi:hypothetical protein
MCTSRRISASSQVRSIGATLVLAVDRQRKTAQSYPLHGMRHPRCHRYRSMSLLQARPRFKTEQGLGAGDHPAARADCGHDMRAPEECSRIGCDMIATWLSIPGLQVAVHPNRFAGERGE